MLYDFIAHEANAHSQVLLLKAESEEQAWELYLEHEWDYEKQQDGTYCHKPIAHDGIQDVLDTYGITQNNDGSYSDASDTVFPSLQDVKSVYSIEEGDDGTIVSKGKCYLSLADAVKSVVGQAHRIELARCDIRIDLGIQTIFTSKDEWDYVEQASPGELATYTMNQHRWQSIRYEQLGYLSEALVELRSGLRLATLRKDRLPFHLDIARLLVNLKRAHQAVNHYKQALSLSTEFDDRERIIMELGKTYEIAGEYAQAARQYKRALSFYPDTENRQELELCLARLQGQ